MRSKVRRSKVRRSKVRRSKVRRSKVKRRRIRGGMYDGTTPGQERHAAMTWLRDIRQKIHTVCSGSGITVEEIPDGIIGETLKKIMTLYKRGFKLVDVNVEYTYIHPNPQMKTFVNFKISFNGAYHFTKMDCTDDKYISVGGILELMRTFIYYVPPKPNPPTRA